MFNVDSHLQLFFGTVRSRGECTSSRFCTD